MKTRLFAIVLGACFILSGCSSVSQENSSPNSEGSNGSFPLSSTAESSSSLITISSEPQAISDDQRREFDEKCEAIIEQLVDLMSGTVGYNVQFTKPNVQYDNDDVSLSKIYVIKISGNGEDYRHLYSFLDIYCEDEYLYFQAAKKFISFIDENAIEISGRDQYGIAINSNINNGISDIGISRNEYGIDIVYGNRNIRSAYSDRLKNMELLKESNESLALPGLLKYDDLPKDVVPYDITVEYQGDSLTHKWYRLENGDDDKVFVTYIDDGTYDDMSDDELVYYAYNSILDPQNESDPSSFESYDFYFAYKSGEGLVCSIHYDPRFQEYSYVTWISQYDYLNSNPLNEELLRELTEEKSK